MTMTVQQPPADVSPKRPKARRRRVHLRTVPSRIRALTVAAVLAVAVLFGVANWAVGNARDGLQTIGHDAGPQVVATGDLFYALNDMDAQVANVLLLGRDHNLGKGRQAALQRYDRRRSEANQALLQAAQLAGDDATEKRTVREALDALGRYEGLAAQAMQLDAQRPHPAGPPAEEVLALYRQATDLMKLELLPKAYNLTLESGSIVRRTYETKHSSLEDGWMLVLAAGLLVVLTLTAVQLYLARRFRRLLNPALALATVGALALVGATAALLAAQAGRIKEAKEDGFDSVLALSRARAISNSAYADESRYLLDPARSDTYEQVYFDKSLSILYVAEGSASLTAYYGSLGTAVNQFRQAPPALITFLGFFGDQARQADQRDEAAAVEKVLTTYQAFQNRDRQIRALVNANRRPAALGQYLNAREFGDYDQAMVELSNRHRATFDTAINEGDDGLRGWNAVLPGASAALVLLVLIGVRPRLAEYR